MLIDRTPGQRIVINPGRPGQIVVEVVDIGRGRVRLGFTSVAAVPIHREEIWVEIRRQREQEKQTTLLVGGKEIQRKQAE